MAPPRVVDIVRRKKKAVAELKGARGKVPSSFRQHDHRLSRCMKSFVTKTAGRVDALFLEVNPASFGQPHRA